MHRLRAKRFEADHRCRIGEAGIDGHRDRALGQVQVEARGRRHRERPHLWIGVADCPGEQAIVHGGDAGKQRAEREAANARGFCARPREEPAERIESRVARRPSAAARALECVEALGHTQPIGRRAGGHGTSSGVDERVLGLRDLVGVHVRQQADRLANRFADVRHGFDVKPRDECVQRRRDGRSKRRGRRLAGAAKRRGDGVRGLRAQFGQLEVQRRRDVGDENRTLETTERANREERRVGVDAPHSAAKHGDVVRRRRAPLRREQHGDARGLGVDVRRKQDDARGSRESRLHRG